MKDGDFEPVFWTTESAKANAEDYAENEEAYRRGYYQGFDDAIEAYRNLCRSGKRDFRGAYAVLAQFFDDVLRPWRYGDCNEAVEPPQIDIKAHPAVRDKKTRQAIFEKCGGLCGICHKPVDPAKFHVDHIKPLSQGGTDEASNWQIAHPSCNARKWTY